MKKKSKKMARKIGAKKVKKLIKRLGRKTVKKTSKKVVWKGDPKYAVQKAPASK